MSYVIIILAILLGSAIVGATFAYFIRARRKEASKPIANIASAAAPVPIAEEVKEIGAQIEQAMADQRHQGETQRQLLAQKLDAVRNSVEVQKHQVQGLRSEFVHESRRRDHEIANIRDQIGTIQQTVGLPVSAQGSQAALPPAAPTPPTDPAPPSALAPAPEPEDDLVFPLPAPSEAAPSASAPPPTPEEASFEDIVFAPSPAAEALAPRASTPDEPSFETIAFAPSPAAEALAPPVAHENPAASVSPLAFEEATFEVAMFEEATFEEATFAEETFAVAAPDAQEPVVIEPAPTTPFASDTFEDAFSAPSSDPAEDDIFPDATFADATFQDATFQDATFQDEAVPDQPADEETFAEATFASATFAAETFDEATFAEETFAAPTFDEESFTIKPPVNDLAPDTSEADPFATAPLYDEPVGGDSASAGDVFESWAPAPPTAPRPTPRSAPLADVAVATPRATPAPDSAWISRPQPEATILETASPSEFIDLPPIDAEPTSMSADDLVDLDAMLADVAPGPTVPDAPTPTPPLVAPEPIAAPEPLAPVAQAEPPPPVAPIPEPIAIAPVAPAEPVHEAMPPVEESAPAIAEAAPLSADPVQWDAEAAPLDTEADTPPALVFEIPEGAEDLTVITSIDEDIQRLLYLAGVRTLEEIAQWGRGQARRISGQVNVSEDTIMNQWVFEAQAALFSRFSQG